MFRNQIRKRIGVREARGKRTSEFPNSSSESNLSRSAAATLLIRRIEARQTTRVDPANLMPVPTIHFVASQAHGRILIPRRHAVTASGTF